MNVIHNIMILRKNISEARELGKKIIFIPTMGALHSGHLSMVEAARKRGGDNEKNCIVLSIFVNPLQFGPNEDYQKYPRNLEQDSSLAAEAGVDILFAPPVMEMYPDGKSLTTVNVAELGDCLCGAKRPGHFRGVTTVVSKLFNIVQPDIAYFGQKDYQQYAIIRKMVEDLNFPVQLILAPTVRENDGLAKSSRNVYLDPQQRRQVAVISSSLREAAALIAKGEKNPAVLRDKVSRRITSESDGKIDYIEVRRADDLSSVETIDCGIVIAVAVNFGSTRLIDNVLVEV